MPTVRKQPVRPLTPIDAQALSDWFDLHARELPWREQGTSAWEILLCEVMSQQTPVDRVIPTWRAWLLRWPGPAELAAAPTAEVLVAWGKLGYPRRALRLQECAREICLRHGGVVPTDVAELLALPGIGQYTSRAVAAFAYGKPVPVVDTNIRRVLARAGAGSDSGGAPSAQDLPMMAAAMPSGDLASVKFCAAMMELGARVCKARKPLCQTSPESCPLVATCAWRKRGFPPFSGKRRTAQKFEGTDRQVRGKLLDVFRDGPFDGAGLESRWLPRSRLDHVWPDPVQRNRALASLLADGLLMESDGKFSLPR